MKILGISAYFHDSSAALVVDGCVIAAAQEERFTRIKHDNSFPANACKFCLEYAGITLADIDVVVFYEKPFLKFERILRSQIVSAPKSFATFIKSMPIWLHDKLNMRRTIRLELKNVFGSCQNSIKFVEHHLSHAALAFYSSGYENADIIVIDAVGESATTSLWSANKDCITIHEEMHFPNSIGMLYSGFTEFLGFKVNSDEYKVMGLAPYGNANKSKTERYIQLIKNNIVQIHPDGSFELNLKYFQFQYGFHTINRQKFEALFGIKQREQSDPISEEYECIAQAIQLVTTELIKNVVTRLRSDNHSNNLCICGGVALNCAINGILNAQHIYSNIHVPFAPGDCGCSIGAAIAYAKLNGETIETVSTPYLGTAFSNDEVLPILDDSGLQFTRFEDNALCEKVAQLIASGSIIGWFQGRMEVGPRALGNRSILANPQIPEMKDKINSCIKFREAFRPFAPSVMKEYPSEYFADCTNSPYMMTTYKVRDGVNDVPAITHIDRTARVQTVSQKDNELYYQLIREFYNLTGCPMLLNTSFNVMGEPIVCTPADAIKTFKNSGLNYVVIGNYLISK